MRPKQQSSFTANVCLGNLALEIGFGRRRGIPQSQFPHNDETDVMTCALVFSAGISQPNDEFHRTQGSGFRVQYW